MNRWASFGRETGDIVGVESRSARSVPAIITVFPLSATLYDVVEQRLRLWSC